MDSVIVKAHKAYHAMLGVLLRKQINRLEHRDLPVPTALGEVEIPNYCKNCGAKVMR